jgi:anthranilate synthase component I
LHALLGERTLFQMSSDQQKDAPVFHGVYPDYEEFAKQSAMHPVVPVWVELVADCETPLSLLAKLRSDEAFFLLESAEQNDLVGRYSFVGSGSRAVISSRGETVIVKDHKGTRSWSSPDPLSELESLMRGYRCAVHPELPGFTGGAVGYLGYEAVRRFEPSVPSAPIDDLGVPEMLFLIADTVVAFDHKGRRIKLVASAFPGELGVEEAWRDANARISSLLEKLAHPMAMSSFPADSESQRLPVSSNFTRGDFEKAIEDSKEYIRAGDIFQIVLSQRFSIPYAGDPIHLYRALRHVNPSPYMFCLQLPGGFSLVGSSPEVHVKVTDGNVQIRPIAGTRKRGGTASEDEALSLDLLDDPKERAEHLMLVDLARNDVGRISEYGSVRLTDFMTVERYSHVMHIVSNVVGRLAGDHSPLDVLRATFPAGTVSGSPKVRAMQIIAAMEPTTRGSYAGAVGYLGFNGEFDSCIALRTVLLKEGVAYVQAGAGVVADSNASAEYEETVNKAMGVLHAVELATATAR